MQNVRFPTPILYGDHHVQEVRRVLLTLPGVLEVYASSCFHLIEVGFDPVLVSLEEITTRLEEAGYLSDQPALEEGAVLTPNRRSVVLDQSRPMVGFQQDIPHQNRSAWPCPGMGLLNVEEEKYG